MLELRASLGCDQMTYGPNASFSFTGRVCDVPAQQASGRLHLLNKAYGARLGNKRIKLPLDCPSCFCSRTKLINAKGKGSLPSRLRSNDCAALDSSRRFAHGPEQVLNFSA